MDLYGIYAEHTQEACPLYNDKNRKFLLSIVPTIKKEAEKHNVKILHQFHSALEHTFLWVVQADNPHVIEYLMSRTAGVFNTLKIVPLITFQTVVERCQKIEEGSFFSQNAT